jgi:CDP-6-deoxy-D-xylo-4-hexulose-3-dehydrase
MKKNKWPLIENAIKFNDRLKLSYFLLTNTHYTNGPKVREFEAQWAEWIGSKHALMVSSGSTANLLLLSAIKEKYNLKDGDKVLVPACTWVTNVSPVFQLGFTPIFCDVNLENFSFDLNHMKEIKKKHPDIKVIFVTHLLGFSAENEEYSKIFPKALIIDDICESHGCKDTNGVKRGANSIAASFSFYFGHHMTTVEGGMVNTNDSELYELMRMKRSHGLARESGNLKKYTDLYPNMHPQFLFVTDGYNFRSSDINAILGLQQLPRLDRFVEQRRHNFSKFVDIVSKYKDLFYPVYWQEGNSNFSLPFICRDKEIYHRLKTAFDENGIEHRPIVGGNLLSQPFLKGYKFGTPRKNSNADLINDNGIYIGNSQFLNKKHFKLLENIINSLGKETL